VVTVSIATSDSKIWNRDESILKLSHAMSCNESITVDLLNEGPDLNSIGLVDLLLRLKKQFNYSQQIKILTNNLIQPDIEHCIIVKSPPMHFVKNTRERLGNIDKTKQINEHFGIFIGRSNLHRLYLSSYLNRNYPKQTCQTYHYSVHNNFHKDNLGLAELIKCTGFDYVDQAVDFLKLCPIMLDDTAPVYPILMDQHCDIDKHYSQFFVEIVCETYFSGQTFFPTEKTWRPIIMKTPFIVQGPQYFLHKLRDIGFQTFNQWWSEGYSEDPAGWQPYEIKKILDQLAKLSLGELQSMYHSMTSILEHNYKTLMSLSVEDFNKLNYV